MKSDKSVRVDRLIPEIPPVGKKIKLIIDSDVGNEIDDFYAIALALAAPERFDLLGICAAHYNNRSPGAGPESIETSVTLAKRLLSVAEFETKVPVYSGSEPMRFFGHPENSDGVEFILEQARKATESDPLWIVILGAATTSASALLADDTITDKVRFVFHSRSDQTWPQRSVQFNVKGDIHAVRTILQSRVPLVWFDTGTQLTIPYSISKKHLRPINALGKFLHDYRDEADWFAADDKGFFDMGDIVFLLHPEACVTEICRAPLMDAHMYFDFSKANGKMLRVFDIDNNASWNILFDRLRAMGLPTE